MAAVSLCLLTGSAQAVETFNETDDYKAHSTTPEDAAFNYASTLLKFLR